MDPWIRPIGPVDRDVDPILRVERPSDEGPAKERQERGRKPRSQPAPTGPAPPGAEPNAQDGPVEGDDGHLHIDIRA